MWWMGLAFGAPTVFGSAAFRAPDGVATARIFNDGTAWTVSVRGEVTGFSATGDVVQTFQACPTRSMPSDMAIDARHARLAVACDGSIRVFGITDGTLLFTREVFAASLSFSTDGRTLGALGERIVDGESEEESHLLTWDATQGTPRDGVPVDWDRVIGVRDGWVGITTHFEEGGDFELVGRVQLRGQNVEWKWPFPPERMGDSWDPGLALTTIGDAGTETCVMADRGAYCLHTQTGQMIRKWVPEPSTWTADNLAMPHPGGLGVGTELWFQRPDGSMWRWDGDAVSRAPTSDVPAVSSDGKKRFIVGDARLSAVATGEVRDSWDLPVSVDRAEDGTLAIADNQGEIWWIPPGGKAFKLDATGERVDVSDDGQALLVLRDDEPAIRVRRDGHVTKLESSIAAFGGSALWWIAADGNVVSDGGKSWGPVDEDLEVTGLSVGSQALVNYGQDDLAQLMGSFGVERPVRAASMPRVAPRGTTGGLRKVDEVDGRWKVGSRSVGWASTVRFTADGTATVEFAEDASSFEVRNFPSGTLKSTVDTAGRIHDLWVTRTHVLVALRDGRIEVHSL